MKIGITYNLKKNIPSNLPDAEAEFDEEETVYAIKAALESGGYKVDLFEAIENLPIRLLENRPDIVFNIAEGLNGIGREAQVPAILNFLNIPFTGSQEATLCVAMDKSLTKMLASSGGILTPQHILYKRGDNPIHLPFDFPMIIKPNAEGSSKGISDVSVVNDSMELHKVLDEKVSTYKQDMLIEEYIGGREFTVGILGNGDDMYVFPPMEIIFDDKSHGIYSYEVKRNFKQHVSYKCPPDINAGLQHELENTAKKIFTILSCNDMCRVDFRLSQEGRLYFIEINPLPGLAPGYSDFPMIAEFDGMDYTALVLKIIECAIKRSGLCK